MTAIHTTQEDPAVTTGRVLLPSGHVALFDAADQTVVDQFRWFAQVRPHTVYVHGYRRGHAPDHGRERVMLHRLLLDPPAVLDVDHINGNGLDNRRANLRLGTRSQNNANTWPGRNTSGYKGVSFKTALGKWVAYITVDGARRHLGVFTDPWAAAQAYNAAALEAWGTFARLNEQVSP